MNRRTAMKRLGAAGVTSVVAGIGPEGVPFDQTAPSQEQTEVRGPREAWPRLRRIALREFQNRVQGSWLGGIVGTLFGMPFEGKAQNVMARLDHFLHSYTYAPVDDDYYYEMVALRGFERHGVGMSVEQLGEMWKEYQAGSWGSSEQARLLLEKGIAAPHTGEPYYNRWFHTIGSQFSSDLYGMLTAGMVNVAGAIARRYSHVNGYAEGSDGAVFVAACISEAFFETDLERIVREAAKLISPRSNYRQAIDQVLDGKARAADWRELALEIENRWRPDYPQMNNSVANGALVALALLYGNGNYLDSLNIVTAADDYTDADCNADNVGSVLGALRGLKGLPLELTTQLHDRIYGTSMGPVTFRKIVDERISDLGARIAAVGRRMLTAHGAREEGGTLLIPHEAAREQPLEWFDINDYGKLWNPAWRLANAGRGGPGATYLQWEDRVLVTYPRDTRPCRLERNVLVSDDNCRLDLAVGALPDRPWRLQVLVNDESVLTEVLQTNSAGPDVQYRDLQIDLIQHAGRQVKLRLYHWLLDGKAPGSAYWKEIKMRPAAIRDD